MLDLQMIVLQSFQNEKCAIGNDEMDLIWRKIIIFIGFGLFLANSMSNNRI